MLTTAVEIVQAMEEGWRACVNAPSRPDVIIANGRWSLLYRRMARPPRRVVGGSSVRAIKRKAVRRPW